MKSSLPKDPGAEPDLFKQYAIAETKLVRIREVYVESPLCDTPEKAADFWKSLVVRAVQFNPDVEQMVVLHLNTRRRVMNFAILASGTIDTLLVSPSQVYRQAILQNAAAMVLMHNHPSGDPTPSEADIKVTRDLIRAGQLLKVELLDHVVIGDAVACPGKGFCSLRELGYFYS